MSQAYPKEVVEVCDMFVLKFLRENGFNKISKKFERIAKPPGNWKIKSYFSHKLTDLLHEIKTV